jgi:DNA-binding Lrp family transcriptional regulator
VALNETDRALLASMQDGLPLVSRPYAAVGAALGMHEAEVRARLERLLAEGVIRRLGVVVRHRELGYTANAMAVWDVPDADVTAIGTRMGRVEGVTLCYRRPRCLPEWPYNLFCMIHGRSRRTVMQCLAGIIEQHGLQHYPHAVLFSRRRFKQRGAHYTHADGSSPLAMCAGD